MEKQLLEMLMVQVWTGLVFRVAVCVAVTFGQEMDLVERQLLEMLMDTKLQSFLQLCAYRSSVLCLFSILYQKWSTY